MVSKIESGWIAAAGGAVLDGAAVLSVGMLLWGVRGVRAPAYDVRALVVAAVLTGVIALIGSGGRAPALWHAAVRACLAVGLAHVAMLADAPFLLGVILGAAAVWVALAVVRSRADETVPHIPVLPVFTALVPVGLLSEPGQMLTAAALAVTVVIVPALMAATVRDRDRIGRL